jgi:tRNA (cytidine/uridine-2'-O-)-methyltransferase
LSTEANPPIIQAFIIHKKRLNLMLDIVLYQPEIPQNTGNIIRLCANTGAQLHLIHPLGFGWDDKRLRRAGLDYHEFAAICHYPDWNDFIATHSNRIIYTLSTHANKHYHEVQYSRDAMLLFGPETRGVPQDIREQHHPIRIPMQPESRSLNLSNAVAIVLFEAWRQLGFTGAK